MFDDTHRVLNAGSGGECYDGLRGDFFHVDISEKFIKNLKNSFVSSVEQLPFDNSFFDTVICVGSVVNYCDVLFAISEFNRVLKRGSYLFLEYERSQTGELFLDPQYGASTTIQSYHYNNQENHKLWLYSDSYLNQILKAYSFCILESDYYHSLSSLCNKVIHNEGKAGTITRFDRVLPVSLQKKLAHNRIILCRKIQ